MSNREEIIVGKTVNGKTIAYRVHEGEALYRIYLKEGGALPPELSGGWTDPYQIKSSILAYLARDKESHKQKEAKEEAKRNPTPEKALKEAVKAAKKRPNKLSAKKEK